MKNVEIAKSNIVDQNYILLNQSDFHISGQLKERFLNKYFCQLEQDLRDVHSNRMRARDVFDFCKTGLSLTLSSSEDITIFNKNYEGNREYKRINLIKDTLIYKLAKNFIFITENTNSQGKLGINLFQTFDIVTETRHRDHVNYVLIYCLNVKGLGAITQLSDDMEGGNIVAEFSLQEGEILIFNDSAFYHYTTPLISNTLDYSKRDVIIMTIEK